MDSNRIGAHGAFVAVCVVVFAVFAGCGGGGDGNGSGASGSAPSAPVSDEQAVRDTVGRFYGSFQDPAAYCGFLSQRLLSNGGRERCEREQQRYADAGATRNAKEIKVAVTGAKATTQTTVETDSGTVGHSSQKWVKEGEEWKIDG